MRKGFSIFIGLLLIFATVFLTGENEVEAKSVKVVKASGTYEVTSKNLNVRTNAGSSYKKVGSLKKGATIKVNGKKGNWYRFNYKGENRYVLGKHLKKVNQTSVKKASGTYKVTSESLNVRTNAGSSYKKVGSLKKGETIKVNGKKGNWYRFNYKGKNRYVHGKHLKKVTKTKSSTVRKASGSYEVTSATLNVRTNAGSGYKKVGSLKKGTIIKVNGKKGNWYRFNYKGKNRYVNGKYLIKTTSTGKTKNFKNCTELRKVYPHGVPKGHPAYEPKMDRDKDGWACER